MPFCGVLRLEMLSLKDIHGLMDPSPAEVQNHVQWPGHLTLLTWSIHTASQEQAVQFEMQELPKRLHVVILLHSL